MHNLGTNTASLTAKFNFRAETRHFLTFWTSMASQNPLKFNFSPDLVNFEMKFLCFVQILSFYSNFLKSWTKPGFAFKSRDKSRTQNRPGSRELIPIPNLLSCFYLVGFADSPCGFWMWEYQLSQSNENKSETQFIAGWQLPSHFEYLTLMFG